MGVAKVSSSIVLGALNLFSIKEGWWTKTECDLHILHNLLFGIHTYNWFNNENGHRKSRFHPNDLMKNSAIHILMPRYFIFLLLLNITYVYDVCGDTFHQTDFKERSI